jgi:hypothetical protein
MFSIPGVSTIVMGLFVLCLGLFMWELTYNWYGFYAFFIPGGAMIFWGIFKAYWETR